MIDDLRYYVRNNFFSGALPAVNPKESRLRLNVIAAHYLERFFRSAEPVESLGRKGSWA